MDKFHERLEHVMRVKKISVTRLAELMECNKSQVSRWKNGKTMPTDITTTGICEALSCDYIWLLTGEGEPFPSKKEASVSIQSNNSAPNVMLTNVHNVGGVAVHEKDDKYSISKEELAALTQELNELRKDLETVRAEKREWESQPTQRNIYLRDIVEWMNEEFSGEKERQVFHFNDELRRKYESFKIFSEEKEKKS